MNGGGGKYSRAVNLGMYALRAISRRMSAWASVARRWRYGVKMMTALGM